MRKIYKQEVICSITLLFYWTTPMIFHGKQRKLVMQYSYVEWSKVKLLAGLKQRKSIGSEEQMHRHTSGPLANTGGQKLKKTRSDLSEKCKSMPCIYFNDNSCIFTKHHETNGVFYMHICSSCFAQHDKVSTHSASDRKKLVKNN